MKKHRRVRAKRRMPSARRRVARREETGYAACVAFACGIGIAATVLSAVIFSLIALLCGLSSSLVSALGYAAGAIGFAAAGYASGKRGHAALTSGILTACTMTLICLLLSLLPFMQGGISPIAEILARLGYAAVCVIFAIVGSNRR